MSQGMYGFVSIIVSVALIGVSWWALQAFRFDLFLKNPQGPQAKLLQIIMSIFLGYQMASFLMEYLGWSLIFGQIFS
ncbi:MULTISPECIES: DUF1146 family protein [Brevibacillus]|uniref:DUF1146 domain-containing protein n=1 Tax=Brevibacillus borstelensis AK1 TaxID=1300222 RepID=M8E9X3_9BACL|nr:DUF1146 family protein [Brevibacillus borstelensis]EMT52305.1 hypothetical protein I532_11649 [Brevibacillus borstelensis AK1]KKX54748.1 membrane protein [Brevibacillus borstelensis cifa_chp40]MBE5396092.1 DUF1146 domain-containing protein [Brevibacillus borstelensis]MCC0562998.1 DUF1146 family protein [Brevibacillus borstelensis]MCM3468940.1 DUF1146 family protein [Brevibacillus borstelensis]